MRFVGDAARYHQRCAEFAQRAGKGEQHARENAAPCQGQGYVEKGLPARCAEHGGHFFQIGSDVFKRGAGGLGNQRERYHHGGDDCALPCENEVDAEAVV